MISNAANVRRIWLFLLSVCFALTSIAIAPQSARAQTDDDPTRVVVMPVPSGDVRAVASALKGIPGLKPYPKKWFYKQAEDYGVETQGIFKDPERMAQLMSDSGVSVVVNFKYSAKRELYRVELYWFESGEVDKTFDLDATEDGLGDCGIEAIKTELTAYLQMDYDPEPCEATEDEDPDGEGSPSEEDPDEIRRRLIEEQNKKNQTKQKGTSKQWLRATAQAIFVQRALLIGSTDGKITNYETPGLFPADDSKSPGLDAGYLLTVEAFPMILGGDPNSKIGGYLEISQAFDSVTATSNRDTSDPNATPQETKLSLAYTQFEGALSYKLDTPIQVGQSTQLVKLRLRAGLKLVRSKVSTSSENTDPALLDILPSLGRTAFSFGGHLFYPMIAPGFSLRAGFVLVPFAGWDSQTQALYGEASKTIGQSAYLGGEYMITENVGVDASYNFIYYRSQFTGTGSLGFNNARAYDLLHGLNAGVAVHY